MIHIRTENVVYSMSRDNKPTASCQSGDTVRFDTLDCFGNGLLASHAQLEDLAPDCNPATGPLYVEGAKPGDTLKIEIVDILVGPLGVTLVGPSSEIFEKRLPKVEIRRIPVMDGLATLSPRLSLPIQPMIGVIGVAPEHEAIPTAVPGTHGGNMDCRKIQKGSTLYLPVFVDGALLSMGDLHALMGDGEVTECGLEIEGSVTVKITVLTGIKRTSPALLAEGNWITIASASTLDEASEMAVEAMLDFLTYEIKWSQQMQP